MQGLALLPEKVTQVREAAEKLSDVLGPISGSEFLKEGQLGTAVTQLTYLVRHERGPIAYQLVFFAPEPKMWQLIAME